MTNLIPYFSISVSFDAKLKSYLPLAAITQDHILILQLSSFFEIFDLLNFAACSHHLSEILQIPAVQIRLLKAKVSALENKKQPMHLHSSTNLMTLYYSQYLPKVPIHNTQKEFQSAQEQVGKFNQGVRFYKYLKRQGCVENRESFQRLLKAKGFEEFISFYDNYHHHQKDFARIQSEASHGQALPSWKNVKQNELTQFQAYKLFLQKEKLFHPPPDHKNSSNFNPYISKFEAMEHKLAKEDYLKRKQKKMESISRNNQFTSEFANQESLQKLWQSDQCSREVIKSMQNQERKRIETQQENIKRLRMLKAPKAKQMEVLLASEGLEDGQRLVVNKKAVVNKLFEKFQQFWKSGPMFI